MALRTSLHCLVLMLALLLTSPLFAEDLWIYGSDAQGGQRFASGTPIEQTVWILQGSDPVLGFTFGVAVDPTIGLVTSVDASAELLIANAGGAPDFIDVQMVSGGFTVETVICSSPCSGWESGPYTAPVFLFSVDPVVDNGSVSICFSDALGSPPVPITVTNSQGTVTPNDNCATICITEHQAWEFAAHDETIPYDIQTGVASLTATLTIGQHPCEYPLVDSPGFSFSLGHDPAVLVALQITPAPPLMEINDGNGPDYFMAEIYPDGITLGVVASMIGADELSFGDETEAAYVYYQSIPTALIGSTADVITTLDWNSNFSSPPVTNIIMPGDSSEIPGALIDGIITFVPIDVAHYIRGDSNEDGVVDLADAVGLLSHLFGGEAGPSCPAIGDINSDGSLDVGDPIWLLTYLFSGGAAPGAPFPACGSAGLDDCGQDGNGCP